MTIIQNKKREIDIKYKRKPSKKVYYNEPLSEPLKKAEVEKPKYNKKTQYEINLMMLEREKKRKKIAEQEVFSLFFNILFFFIFKFNIR